VSEPAGGNYNVQTQKATSCSLRVIATRNARLDTRESRRDRVGVGEVFDDVLLRPSIAIA